MAGLFQVLWGQADGTFQVAEALTGTDDEPLIIPMGEDAERNGGTSLENICTRPIAVDWDGDGDLDLVVGNFGGSFYVFQGEGEGKFAPVPVPIMADGELLRIAGAHSDPFVVDWDADGDLDLLSGSSTGGVQWAENRAEAGSSPEFAAFEVLIEVEPQRDDASLLAESDLTGPTTSTRIWVEDVNSDGKLDILVGDSVRLVSPAEGLSEEEYREKHAAWQEKMTKASEEMQAAMLEEETEETADESETEEEEETESSGIGSWLKSLLGIKKAPVSAQDKAQERYMELWQEQSEFMKGDRTGFVWLYLQQ